MKIGFDNEKYLKMQSEHIRERIGQFDNKLYLEFGGKLFDDYHASRVLPGFQPDSKLCMLRELSDQAEIVIVISAEDIEKNKIRGDLGITYDSDVLRLMQIYQGLGLYVGSVVITKYNAQESAELFKNRLEKLGIKVYRHYLIPGYPTNVPFIVSDDGYGKNDYIKTADLNDINMIDPFHLEAYGETTINYNRDVEIFPVLNAMFQRIYGESPYKSPTDMGVNMAGNCICDDDACQEASRQEIIRRYYASRRRLLLGACSEEETYKLEMLMNQANITVHDRPVVDAALTEAERTNGPAAALELPDGSIVTGKTSDLLGACSALLLNALKELAGIEHEIKIISPQAIEPIQSLKTKYLGSRNPRLHTDEVLIALSVSAATSKDARLAMDQLPKLKGCQVHVSVMPGSVDIKQFKRLSIQATFEAKYEKNSVFFNNKGV